MQRIKAAIPNALTLGNLACGLVGIVMLMRPGLFYELPWILAGLMAVAMAFDFLDGFTARALKVASPIGKELDSLADLVTFGVLPGLMMFRMIGWTVGMEFSSVLGLTGLGVRDVTTPFFHWTALPALAALLIPIFSALRLAKFNVDTRQTSGFIGLPTPANAIFMLGIFLIYTRDIVQWEQPESTLDIIGKKVGGLWDALTMAPPRMFFFTESVGEGSWVASWHPVPYQLFGLLAISVVFSLLLVSPIRLMAFKFKSFSFGENWAKYTMVILAIPMLALLTYKALPLLIILYFLLSIIDNLTHKKHEIPG